MRDWAVVYQTMNLNRGRFVLVDWELHGSMGSHAFLAKSAFHCLPHVPSTYLSLDLSLLPFHSLRRPFSFSLRCFSSCRATERESNSPALLSPSGRQISPGQDFLEPSLLGHHCTGCYVCLSSRIDLQTWPTTVLCCPTARRRGIPEGRRHVGTDGRGPLHRRLLL